MWSTLNIDGPNHISGTAKIVIRFCTRVDYIKYQPWDDKLSPNGHAQGHVTHFLKFADLSHIFGVGEVSKFGWQIENDEYWHTRDSLPLNGCVQGPWPL